MTINYHGDETVKSPALENVCNKKLLKMEKLAEDLEVNVYFSKDAKDFVLKMVATTKNWEVMAKEQSDDMYKNIDGCVDKLKKQINDNKPTKSHSKCKKGINVISEE